MNLIYVIVSYVVIGIGVLFGFNYINKLNNTIAIQRLEIKKIKDEQRLLINTYNEEINIIRKSTEKRKTIIKEIVKNEKLQNDPCINSYIPDDIFNKLQKYN